MSLMSRGMDFLNRTLNAAAGVDVTYSRAAASVTLTATVGRTVFRRNEQGGAAVEFGERDYLITAADLILSGVAVEPAEGDRITETINGVAVTFRVVPVLGEPAWRWSDPSRTAYRVHVKRVS